MRFIMTGILTLAVLVGSAMLLRRAIGMATGLLQALSGLRGITALPRRAVGMATGLLRAVSALILLLLGGIALARGTGADGEPLVGVTGGLMIAAGLALLLRRSRSAPAAPVAPAPPPAPDIHADRIAQDRHMLESALRDDRRWWQSEQKARAARRHAVLAALWPIIARYAPGQPNRVSVMQRSCDAFLADYFASDIPSPPQIELASTIIDKLPQRVGAFLTVAQHAPSEQRAEDVEALLRYAERIAADAERLIAARRTAIRADYHASTAPPEPWERDPFAP